MIVKAWSPDGHIELDGGTKIKYHPVRSPFSEIARSGYAYTVDSYTEDEITITHDDPALSGTYELGLDLTTDAESIALEIGSLLPLSPSASIEFSRLIIDLIREMAGDDNE